MKPQNGLKSNDTILSESFYMVDSQTQSTELIDPNTDPKSQMPDYL